MKNPLLKILLAPFSLLYGIGISVRNFLYSKSLLKGVAFDVPVIAVGNLSMGGAGKTPHVEYLVRLLQDYIDIATLSRGYKRKTKGFRIAQVGDTVKTIGDEPLQFFQKFPNIKVAVSENRMLAIPSLMAHFPHLQTIILDDAYQHRSVKPSLNILLTQYRFPFTRDWLLPSGRLREWRSAYRRADVIIVSKCPNSLSLQEREQFRQEIQPFPHQKLFFSKYTYTAPYKLFGKETIALDKNWNVIIVCALANADYMAEYVASKVKRLKRLEYPDHHFYTNYDMSRILHLYQKWDVDNKVIITTEKDATRLDLHQDFIAKNNMKIYVLPAYVSFFENENESFDECVKNHLIQFEV